VCVSATGKVSESLLGKKSRRFNSIDLSTCSSISSTPDVFSRKYSNVRHNQYKAYGRYNIRLNSKKHEKDSSDSSDSSSNGSQESEENARQKGVEDPPEVTFPFRFPFTKRRLVEALQNLSVPSFLPSKDAPTTSSRENSEPTNTRKDEVRSPVNGDFELTDQKSTDERLDTEGSAQQESTKARASNEKESEEELSSRTLEKGDLDERKTESERQRLQNDKSEVEDGEKQSRKNREDVTAELRKEVRESVGLQDDENEDWEVNKEKESQTWGGKLRRALVLIAVQLYFLTRAYRWWKPNVSKNTKSESPKEANERQSKLKKTEKQEKELRKIPAKDLAAMRCVFGSETFFATECFESDTGIVLFAGNLRGNPELALQKMESRLKNRLGDKYELCLIENPRDSRPMVQVTRAEHLRISPSRLAFAFSSVVSVCSFIALAELASVLSSRYMTWVPPTLNLDAATIIASRTSTMTILAWGILIFRELFQHAVAFLHKSKMGMYIYLLPGGPGPIISSISTPVKTRSALFDIAVGGAGVMLIISLVLLVAGFALSGAQNALLIYPTTYVWKSMLFGFVSKFAASSWLVQSLDGTMIGLHPFSVVGMEFATLASVNLLPLPTLDGGRLVNALFGRRTAITLARVTNLLLLLAATPSRLWIWILFATSSEFWRLDVPLKNEITEPNSFRTAVGLFMLICAVAILLPMPSTWRYL